MSCQRCQGFLHTDLDGTRCLNCGHYLVEPDAPPIVVEEARRWESVLCAKCHDSSAVRGHVLCRGCWNKKKVDTDRDQA